jgi:hypothetical protein
MIRFYSDELLVHRPTPNLKDHPSSAVRYRLFNIFTATLYIGGCYSILNPRTRQSVVTWTHLARPEKYQIMYLIPNLLFFYSYLHFVHC